MFQHAMALLFLLLGSVSGAYAYDFSVDDIAYNITSDEAKTVEVAYDHYQGDVVIPSTVNYDGQDYTVTALGVGAFAECGSLTSVTLPETLIAIGNSAFYACVGLTEIALPSQLTSIGIEAFISCVALKSIDIPASVSVIGSSAFTGCQSLEAINVAEDNEFFASVDGVLFDKWMQVLQVYPSAKGGAYSVPEGVSTIGEKAFFGVGGLTAITLPEGVRTISDYAFCGCSSLREVTLPSTVRATLGANAFRDCTNLADVNIPANTIKTIGANAFYHCLALQSITLPEGVQRIQQDAFNLCSNLQDISLPTTLKQLGDGVFTFCTSLRTIQLPEGLLTIGSGVFSNCTSLTDISVPEGVTTIGGAAFENCNALLTVSIPASVTTIGGNAFSGCTSLKQINVDEANTAYSSVNGVLFNKDHTAILALPKGIEGDFDIPEGITELGEAVFSECYGLTGVTIPSTVKSIGFMAFYRCTALTKVFIPASVESIGMTAFGDCYALNTIICAVPEPLPLDYYTFNAVPTWAVNLYVPEESVDAYKEAYIWSSFNVLPAEEGMIPGEGDQPQVGNYTALFDFSAMDPETTPTSNNGHEGDITEDVTITDGDVTLVISPNPNGSAATNNQNRYWLYQNKVQLRMYGGTLTFTVPGGQTIKQLTFNKGQWNGGNNVDGEPLTGENRTTAPRYWYGSAEEVVVNIAGNSQINSIEVAVESQTTGIGQTYTLQLEPGTAYTLSGMKTTPTAKGITIQPQRQPDGSIRMVKVLNR